jgi:hypothetical protein
MFNSKRGACMNFNDTQPNGLRLARIEPGCLSTCLTALTNSSPVVTNGKIVSVSDTVTVVPQTAQAVS